MSLIEIPVKLPPDMIRMAEMTAREEDITLGQLVRQVLGQEISRRKNARPPIRADEQLIAPLRARLASDLAQANGWDDLASRLARHDIALREAGGGLAVHRASNGQRLCKASELGFSYARLIKRFGQAFPGHSHSWIADRVLNAQEDCPVIEPWPEARARA